MTLGISIAKKSDTQSKRKFAPRYKVLLHNDDFNTRDYVVEALMKTVAGMSETSAIAIMMEAHNTGVGLVITCALEHAEFYCESLQSYGLTSTIEPDE